MCTKKDHNKQTCPQREQKYTYCPGKSRHVIFMCYYITSLDSLGAFQHCTCALATIKSCRNGHSRLIYTWNHCPLGRAGLIQAAKKIPLIPNKGQAINMRTPCARTRGNLGKLSSFPLALSLTGLYFLADILGDTSWIGRPSERDCSFRRPKMM